MPIKNNMWVRICKKCGEEKTIDLFVNDKRSASYNCKECINKYSRGRYHAYGKVNDLSRKLRTVEFGFTARQKIQMMATYGITPAQYADILERQNGRCACCNDLLMLGRKRHIDHNHETKIIRGIICGHCNFMIGHAKDDPVRLRAGAEYLERTVAPLKLVNRVTMVSKNVRS